MRAVQITEFGGPEVLKVVQVPDPEPGPGSVLIEVACAGVNYADTHQTENSYLAPQTLPLIPGAEVVGTVLGGELDGRRVVALTMAGGGYAERVVAHPSVVFPLPDDVEDGVALSLVLQGSTAWHLLRSCGHLRSSDTVVVHAAAGGVGSLAVQLAKQWGAARVIATASTPEKRELAIALGADAAVDVSTTTTAREVQDRLVAANAGRPVDLVLEMTGGHVTDGSLAALAPWGRLALYGMASGTQPAPIAAAGLMATTRTVTGFWLVHALRRPGGLAPVMEELMSLVRAGRLKPIVGGSYPLAQAGLAHQDLRARRTTGKLVLQIH